MYHLVKMDLYRLFHSISTYVMLFAAIGFTIFTVVMTKADLDRMNSQNSVTGNIVNENQSAMVMYDADIEIEISAEKTEISEADLDEIETKLEETGNAMTFGIFSETREEWMTGNILFEDFMETECKSGIFLLLCSIFVSIFVHADQKHGFLKNIAGQVPDKWMLVVSKMIGTGVQNLVMFGVIFITMGAAGKIYFGDGFVIGSGMDILKVLGSQYLLHMGFSGLILCMCILFRSSALSMTAGIMLSCRVTALIYPGINRLAELYFQADGFDISKYAIEFNVITFSVDAQRDDIVRAMMVAAGVLVVSVFISGVVTQNRDIR